MLLLKNEPGQTHLLLGNEAIVRGALEAGVGFISAYPGTPSSEVPDTFYRLSPHSSYYFEYSANEKVALEVGGGAALAGVPTLVTMKHVGLNVAADPLMSLAYVGTPGGMVILCADDPGCHSSQNEQDTRFYARLAGLPCFEPATVQEAKEMTRQAFALSAKWEQPILLRTTTRLNHMRAPVTFASLAETKNKGQFQKNPFRYVLLPAVARLRHPALLTKLDEIREELDQSPWNKTSGQGELGIIASGISRCYLHDALQNTTAKEFKILELGTTFPLPEKTLLSFLKGLKKVLVLEELEPILETEIRALAHKEKQPLEVLGKGKTLTRIGEYSTLTVKQAIMQILGKQEVQLEWCSQEKDLPKRPPNLCAGCAHRAVFYAIRKIFADQAIYATDIGCYTLGFLPPLKAADFLFCMGSSISGGSGMAKATGKTVVAYIGDSTFFHSGLTGLVNAVHNQHDLLLVILDNKTTAMTGHQPHPGVEQTMLGPNPVQVDIEKIVQGAGVTKVKKIKPFNLKATFAAINEFKDQPGVRVLIAEEPCMLFANRVLRKKRPMVAYVSETNDEVKKCMQELACPAFYLEGKEIQIDPNLCSGCMVCVQISQAIKSKKRD